MELFFCHKNVEIKSIIPSLAEYIENWFGENKMRKTLSPKLDVVFQALFGEVGRVGIPFNMENNRNRRKKKNIEREIRN